MRLKAARRRRARALRGVSSAIWLKRLGEVIHVMIKVTINRKGFVRRLMDGV